MPTTKKVRKSSSSRRRDAPVDKWKQFTSPDGHPYYYNAATKESRWELPVENEAEPRVAINKEMTLEQDAAVNQEKLRKYDQRSKAQKKHLQNSTNRTEAIDTKAASTPKNAMVQKLQASLEGRLKGPIMGQMKAPAVLNIRQKEQVGPSSELPTQSLDEQYEVETVGMSAAERLRFLRKKRQEDMRNKSESLAKDDDFMAEVTNNLKKKGVRVKSIEQQRHGRNPPENDWKQQEQAEMQRKRQQMQQDMAEKEQKERKQQHEQERTPQFALDLQREQARQEMRKTKPAEKKQDQGDTGRGFNVNTPTIGPELDAASTADILTDPVEDHFDESSRKRVVHRRQESNLGRSTQLVEQSNMVVSAAEDEPSPDLKVAIAQEETKQARGEQRARRKRDKGLATVNIQKEATSEDLLQRRSVSTIEPRTRSTSSIELDEVARAQEKHFRRRIAKLEAALTALRLERDGGKPPQHECLQQHMTSSTRVAASSDLAAWYATNNQPLSSQEGPGQPPLSGGMDSHFPFVIVPPVPLSLYGCYHSIMPPPAMPMSMDPHGIVPSGCHPNLATVSPSMDGTVAVVPFNADPHGGLFGQQTALEISKCEGCQGVGVGLVGKNGFCAHCTRLRLAFVLSSAQMRQRCSACSGWGFQLLQANGMCAHCTRQTAKGAQDRLVIQTAASRRRVAASTNDELNGFNWDYSSSDDSDWDD